MPYCEACSKYWTPNSMNDDGTCPQCGELVEEPHVHDDDEKSDEKTPWHFKLLVGVLVFYLSWRFWQIATGNL